MDLVWFISERAQGEQRVPKAKAVVCLILQVWEKNRKVKSIDLSALEKHGQVYEDGEASLLLHLAWDKSGPNKPPFPSYSG